MRRVCYPYTDGLTAAGGTYTLCTAPDSRSTVWKPLVEAYTTLDLPALVTTMSTRRGLLGRSGNDCGGGEGEGGKGRRGRRGRLYNYIQVGIKLERATTCTCICPEIT